MALVRGLAASMLGLGMFAVMPALAWGQSERLAGGQVVAESPPREVSLEIPPWQPIHTPAACVPTMSGSGGLHEDCNDGLLRGDPLLDPVAYPTTGWFAALDIGILVPHVQNRLADSVTVGTHTFNVHLPGAPLDWTGSPRLDLGYRLPDGFGEIVVTYRSLVSEGTDVMLDFDRNHEPGSLKSRLNLNMVDVNYSARSFALGPWWDMKWQTGIRLASIFFDSRATGPTVEKRVSNDFQGIGPDLGLALWRRTPIDGLSLYGRFETAGVIGRIKQGFEEDIQYRFGQRGGAMTERLTQASPMIDFETGLAWTLAPYHARLAVGYSYEVWWSIGLLGNSNALLTDQGVFLRAEWNF